MICHSVLLFMGSVFYQFDLPNNIDIVSILHLNEEIVYCEQTVPLLAFAVKCKYLDSLAQVLLQVEMQEIDLLLQIAGVLLLGSLYRLDDQRFLAWAPKALGND